MFSMITNIYNKKTKGPVLMELFTATGKLKKVFFLTTRDVRCVHYGNTAHIDKIFNNLNIVSMCAVSPVVHTSNISSCKKKTFSVFLWL